LARRWLALARGRPMVGTPMAGLGPWKANGWCAEGQSLPVEGQRLACRWPTLARRKPMVGVPLANLGPWKANGMLKASLCPWKANGTPKANLCPWKANGWRADGQPWPVEGRRAQLADLSLEIPQTFGIFRLTPLSPAETKAQTSAVHHEDAVGEQLFWGAVGQRRDSGEAHPCLYREVHRVHRSDG